MRQQVTHAAVLAAFALLAGCSSGPSQPEVEAAVQKAFGSAFMGVKLIEYSSIKKIGCTAKEGGYVCDVELTMKAMGQQQTQMQRLRFVKGSDGWMVAGPAAG